MREAVIRAALNRSIALVDYKIYNDMHRQFEFRKQTLLADDSLTEEEKTEAIKNLNKIYDRSKINNNKGTKRICENCNKECLATLYCEYCIRNYLITKFSNWTSGNSDIDNLIKKCQSETNRPTNIIEWIPYNDLQNIDYLTKGGFSEIYTANWINGAYYEWDHDQQKLKRLGIQQVILKSLENIENANQNWFDEVRNLKYLNIHRLK
jgi:hypothetical protein